MRTLTPGQKLVRKMIRETLVCLNATGGITGQYDRHAVAWAKQTKKWVGDNYPTIVISDVSVMENYPNISALELTRLAN